MRPLYTTSPWKRTTVAEKLVQGDFLVLFGSFGLKVRIENSRDMISGLTHDYKRAEAGSARNRDYDSEF